MGIFDNVKKDMLLLIELSAEIGKYNQILLRHNEISDERNYNAEKVELIRKKIMLIEVEYQRLYGIYF